MATIRKRGKSYLIRAYCGYAIDGKQIEKTMTYKPLPGMTEKQAEKQAQKIAFEFEQKCQNGLILDNNIKFADFAEKWFKEYAQKQLKAKTVHSYKELFVNVNKALGHLKLSNIQPFHLIEFYNNLAEEGVRADTKYKAITNLKQLLKEKQLTHEQLRTLTGLSESTIRSALNNKNISCKSAKAISDALDCQKLFEPVEPNKTLVSSTIRRYHYFISSILSRAVEWQIIPYNPCLRVKPPKIKEKKQAYLDNYQAIEFIEKLDTAPLKYKALVNLYIDSGARRGEILGLEWPDLIKDDCLISISKESVYVPGLGIFDDTPKNDESKRVIKISSETVKLLLLWKKEQSRTRLLMGDQWQGSKKIFTSNSGGPMHPDTASWWIKKFAESNNFPGIHAHSLRHTNATLLIANGTDLRTVANRLGHAKTSTTTNIYTHAIKMADEKAADTLSIVLSRKA